MKTLLAFLLVSFACFASPRTVSGPLQNPSNSGANGTVKVEWQTFTAGDGSLIVAGSRVTTVSSGTYSQTFEPTSDASPSGVTYKVTYTFGSASPSVCYWTIPAGSGTVLIANIQTCSPPSAPAGTISLSQLSIGAGSNGQCLIISTGVWAPNTCTFNWTTNGNDIYNSNTANVGLGATPGTYKLDISKSGSSGTMRIFDQTASTGSSLLRFQAGAGQGTTPFIQAMDSAASINYFYTGFEGAQNTNTVANVSANPGNYYGSMILRSGGGGSTGDHSLVVFDSLNTPKWKVAGVWNGVSNFRIQDPEAGEAVRFQITKATGVVVIPNLGGSGSKYVCVDNSGNLSVGSTC